MKILIILLLLSANALAQDTLSNETEKKVDYNSKKFRFILETAIKHHKDSIDIDKVSEAAYKAMLNAMDRQSDYFSAKQLKELQEKSTGTGEGVGLQVVVINDTAVVASVAPNSPAYSAKINRGDMILFINDMPLKAKSGNEITEMLNGEIGSKVNLIVKSYQSGALENIVLSRAAVHTSAVSTSFIVPNSKVGYIMSPRFTSKIEEEVVSAIDGLVAKGANSLMIDLRGNLGGFLEQVVKLLEEFLPKGKVITYTESKNKEYFRTFKTTRNGKYRNLPLIVLIDEQSASASEIFAGAIQDLDRGIVVGANSFGKGTIQRLWNVNDGSGFRLTIGEYHTPLGRTIDKANANKIESSEFADESLRLQIGDEAYNQLLKTMQQTGGKTQIPIFRTAKNRVIFGNGGIFPDVKVTADTTTLLSKVLMSRGIFFEFALNYFKENENLLKSKYIKIEDYLNNFVTTNEIYNDFVKFSYSKNIWNEAMANTDINFIKNMIKSNIAHFLWDNFGFQAAKSFQDKVFLKGLQEIEKAKILLN